MTIDRAHQPEWNDRHDDQGARPGREHPAQRQVDPKKAQHQTRQGIAQEITLLFRKPRHDRGDPVFFLDVGKDDVGKLLCDRLGARGIVFGDITGHGDNAHSVFTAHGRESGTGFDGHDVRKRYVDAAGRPDLGPFDKVCGQLSRGQLHPD